MKTTLFAALAALGLGAVLAPSASADLNLYALKTIDLSVTSDATSASSIGSNPSAVAWNGTDLYVSGFNASGNAGNSAIVRVSNALGAGAIGTSFGAFSVPDGRGYSGLAVQGNTLLASLDTGAGTASSEQAFNLDGTFRWNIVATDQARRGTAGPAFDPGFGGTATAASGLVLGSGRRARFDLTTGTAINTFSGGPIINFATAATTWRDHVYDPATGDLYTRESNRVGKAVRTADQAFAVQTVLVANTTATNVNGQNLAFVNDLTGNTILFNDRSVTTPQSFASVVKAVDASGNAVAVNTFGFSPADGNGYYDFSWDARTRTLAVSDFSARTVTIFATTQPVPEPGTLAALGFGAAALLRRRRRA